MTASRRIVVAQSALRELERSLDWIEQNTGRARIVLDAIHGCLRRIGRFPEAAPIDPRAPTPARGSRMRGRTTHVVDFVVRYLYPVGSGRQSRVVLVVSIRHARRRPVRDPEFVRRFVRELAKLRAEPRS